MIILHSHGVGRGVKQTSRLATEEQKSSLERLSTGSRVNHAKDDAARLGVSENLEAASRSKRAAIRNIEDAMSMAQNADGGLETISNTLKQARVLAIQASSETLDATERAYVQEEFAGKVDTINDIANTTKYDTTPLLSYATVDVGLIVDVSQSMNGEITEVKNSIASFVSTLDSANLQAGLGLAEMGPDITDNVTRLADIDDGNFGAELNNLSIFGQVSMDPFASLFQTSGVDDFSGNDDPDAFNWREGTQRKTLVMITDTFRETSVYLTTKNLTAQAMQNAEVEVHTINRPIHNTTYYDTIASLSGGQNHDIGDSSGSGISGALQDIATSLSDDYGVTSIEVQASDKAGADSLIQLDLPVNATATGLGLTTASVATVEEAQTAIGEIDSALDTVSGYRSTIGAATNRLQKALDAETRAKSDIDHAGENITSADIATESAESVRQQTKAQASQAIMAQSARIQRLAIDSLLNDK